MRAQARPGLSHSVGLDKNFWLQWTASSLSTFGDLIFEYTLVLWIATDLAKDRSWSALAVSGILVASAIPSLILGPIAGVFADRWWPKHTVLLANLVSAGLVVVPIVIARLDIREDQLLIAVYVDVALASAVAQFIHPSNARIIKAIVEGTELPRAMSLNQTSYNVMLLIAPALSAPIFALVGPYGGLVVNGASFILAALLIGGVNLRRGQEEQPAEGTLASLWSEFRSGLSYFAHSSTLRAVATCMLGTVFGVGILEPLLIYFTTDQLGSSAERYGLLASAQASGMIIGSLLGTLIAPKLPLATTLWVSICAVGISVLFLSRTTSFELALAIQAQLGIWVAMLPVALGPLVLRATETRYTGRVSGIMDPLMNLGALTGVIAGGVLYSVILRNVSIQIGQLHFGPLDTTMAIAGLICIAAGLTGRVLLPRRDSIG